MHRTAGFSAPNGSRGSGVRESSARAVPREMRFNRISLALCARAIILPRDCLLGKLQPRDRVRELADISMSLLEGMDYQSQQMQRLFALCSFRVNLPTVSPHSSTTITPILIGAVVGCRREFISKNSERQKIHTRRGNGHAFLSPLWLARELIVIDGPSDRSRSLLNGIVPRRNSLLEDALAGERHDEADR